MDTTVKKQIPDSPEIHRQAEYVEDQRKRLALAEKSLTRMIAEFQKNCDHNFEPVKEYDKDYWLGIDAYGMDVYIGKKCKRCKLFEPRPNGSPWEICYKCGGKMEYIHLSLETRLILYVCEVCGHKQSKAT